jgi:hypothetical protein
MEVTTRQIQISLIERIQKVVRFTMGHSKPPNRAYQQHVIDGPKMLIKSMKCLNEGKSDSSKVWLPFATAASANSTDLVSSFSFPRMVVVQYKFPVCIEVV